jgi:hypothetical protein
MEVKDYVATKNEFTNFNETLKAEGLLRDMTNRLKQNIQYERTVVFLRKLLSLELIRLAH